MKYLTVTKAVETLAEDAKDLVFVFKTDKLTKNKFNQLQGTPCLTKIDDKVYTFGEIMSDFLDEPFIVQFKGTELPRGKFTVLHITCTLKTTDKYDYYPISIHPLAQASLAKANEAQKKLDEQDNNALIGVPFEI